MYKSLVIIHKIVKHDYFMDKMQLTEINIATEYLEYNETISWMQAREQMLCTLKPYLNKKNITSKELMPLPIDEDNKEKAIHTTEISNEDVEYFNNFCKEYEKQKGSN